MGTHNQYRQLYNAAERGDWKSAKSLIEHDPNALTARKTFHARTILHVAAERCQWGFILKLLELLPRESIAMQDSMGNTVLHYVTEGGSLETAKAVVDKNPDLLQIVNNLGHLPLLYSVNGNCKELVWYLSLRTRVESPSFPFFVPLLTTFLRGLINSGYNGKSQKQKPMYTTSNRSYIHIYSFIILYIFFVFQL